MFRTTRLPTPGPTKYDAAVEQVLVWSGVVGGLNGLGGGLPKARKASSPPAGTFLETGEE